MKWIAGLMAGAIVLLAHSLPPLLAQKIGNKGVVVVDFFASWCHSCQKELPAVQRFIHSHPNIRLISVDVDEDKETGEAFVKELGLQGDVIFDTKGSIVESFDPAGIPALYIFKDGKLKQSIIGARENIEVLLLEAIR